jgi:hypothetical protein
MSGVGSGVGRAVGAGISGTVPANTISSLEGLPGREPGTGPVMPRSFASWPRDLLSCWRSCPGPWRLSSSGSLGSMSASLRAATAGGGGGGAVRSSCERTSGSKLTFFCDVGRGVLVGALVGALVVVVVVVVGGRGVFGALVVVVVVVVGGGGAGAGALVFFSVGRGVGGAGLGGSPITTSGGSGGSSITTSLSGPMTVPSGVTADPSGVWATPNASVAFDAGIFLPSRVITDPSGNTMEPFGVVRMGRLNAMIGTLPPR